MVGFAGLTCQGPLCSSTAVTSRPYRNLGLRGGYDVLAGRAFAGALPGIAALEDFVGRLPLHGRV